MFFGQITVVNRLQFSPLAFLHVTAGANPFRAQRGQPLRNGAVEVRIAPRPGAVINAHWIVHLDLAAVRLAIALFGFQSGAALATVVGVLVEVPVMLSVVHIVRRSRGWDQGAKAA